MTETAGDKQRILIVDDSKVIRVTARKILQGHFETVEAVDGENAWDVLSGMGPFSLVISDLTMPKLDGYGLLEKIRSALDPDISSLPVIVITGDSDSESTMKRAREAGATDFIGKPFDAVHLLARAQSHASAHAERQSLTQQNMTLEDQALVDALTGLANESAFMERGGELLSFARRHKSTLTVAQIEIDNYGELHSRHGDSITEMVVKYVANALEAGIRHEDMAARVGPARFAMLLTGMERNGVKTLTERIGRDIGERIIRYGSEKISFTVSIGVCTPAVSEDTEFEDLYRIAGKNLQQAAADHGNHTVFDNTPCAGTPPVNEAGTYGAASDAAPDASWDSAEAAATASEATMVAAGSSAETDMAIMDDAVAAEAAVPWENADTSPATAQPAEATDSDAEEIILADTTAPGESTYTSPATAQPAEATDTGTEETVIAADDHLPEMFAEPVSGVSRNLAGKLNKAKKLAASEKIGKIVIEAPFSAHPVCLKGDSQAVAAAGTAATAAVETAASSSAQQGQGADFQAAEVSPEAEFSASAAAETGTKRKGLFKRILSLFSRSGK